MNNNIDRIRLKSDIHATVGQLCALKAIFRESGQPHRDSFIKPDGTMIATWERGAVGCGTRLAELKGRASLLCSIAASVRGRVHLQKFDREKQADYIGERWRAYEIIQDQAAA